MKYFEKLKQQYKKEIESWDWEKIEKDIYNNSPQYDEYGEVHFSAWLGSITSIVPSGKIYTLWTSNQTLKDIIRDKAYYEVLFEIAESYGLDISIYSGDIFATIYTFDDVFTDDGNRFYFNNKLIAESEKELKEWMDKEGYYPNIFLQDDHGGLTLLTIEV